MDAFLIKIFAQVEEYEILRTNCSWYENPLPNEEDDDSEELLLSFKSFPFVFECNFHHPPPKVFWSFWRASSTSSSLLFHLSIKAFNFLQFFQVIVVTKIVQLRHLRPQFSPQRRTQPQMSTIYRCHFLFFLPPKIYSNDVVFR